MVQNTRETKSPGGVRPLSLPEPVEVKTDEQAWPVAIRVRQRWVAATVEDRWRIDDEWWREDPTTRLYFKLRLASGRLINIYNDALYSWYYQTA